MPISTYLQRKTPYEHGVKVDMNKPIDPKSRCKPDPLLAKLVRTKRANDNTDWRRYAKNTAIGAGAGAGLGGLLNYIRGGSVGKGLAYGGVLGGLGGAGLTAATRGRDKKPQEFHIEGFGQVTPEEYQFYKQDPEGWKIYAETRSMYQNLDRANDSAQALEAVGALADNAWSQVPGRILNSQRVGQRVGRVFPWLGKSLGRIGGGIDVALTVGTSGLEHVRHGDRRRALEPLYRDMQQFIDAGDHRSAAAVAQQIRKGMASLSQQHTDSTLAREYAHGSAASRAATTAASGLGASYNLLAPKWALFTSGIGDLSDHALAARTEASLPEHLRRSGFQVGGDLHRQEIANATRRQIQATDAGIVPGVLEALGTPVYRNAAVLTNAVGGHAQALRDNTNRADDMIARADRWLASGGITPEYHKELVDSANAMRPSMAGRVWAQTGGRAADAGSAAFRSVGQGLGWLGSKIF